jgi:hypothetical protein
MFERLCICCACVRCVEMCARVCTCVRINPGVDVCARVCICVRINPGPSLSGCYGWMDPDAVATADRHKSGSIQP